LAVESPFLLESGMGQPSVLQVTSQSEVLAATAFTTETQGHREIFGLSIFRRFSLCLCDSVVNESDVNH